MKETKNREEKKKNLIKLKQDQCRTIKFMKILNKLRKKKQETILVLLSVV